MARRSREAIQKRLRERKRVEKAEAKRQKKIERKLGPEFEEGAETTGELADGDAPESEDGVIATEAVSRPAAQAEPAGDIDDSQTVSRSDAVVRTSSD